MKISGVYKITNTITGDFYIGSSKNIKDRWAAHKCISTWSENPGMKLYQAMAQYGLSNFKFDIIEETDNLKEREQYYIDLLTPSYNSMRANDIDIERSREARRKYRRSEKGKENNRKSARKSMKQYNNQLCLYNGKTLTLNALSQKFYYQGIAHPTLEAKKYLLDE